ncbi:STP1 protein [Plasmodium malariae]|uniref:STP1 protein n=1 Tax=Plasmodium malariae TaxID=5858 RepID=A0A1D3TDK6_PLAMA|nr:STP1 protein [Plasmodium malariae]SCP02995.1 STP1 protein [Plasmodium malariae]
MLDVYFRSIKNHVEEKTLSLSYAKNVEEFRNECLNLAGYLIQKMSPPKGETPRTWEAGIKHLLRHYFNKTTKYGKCPMILHNKHKEILELKYDEEDFCRKKRRDLLKIDDLKRSISCKCDNEYLTKCKEYNVWIKKMEKKFDPKKSLIQTCYKKKKPKNPLLICDILDSKTFEELHDCSCTHTDAICEELTGKEEKTLQEASASKDESISTSHLQAEQALSDTRASITTQPVGKIQSEEQHEIQVQLQNQITNNQEENPDTPQVQDTESPSSTVSESREAEASERLTLVQQKSPVTSHPSETNSLINSASFSSPDIPLPHKSSKISVFSNNIFHEYVFFFICKYTLMGQLKKKKKIKRRQAKFLKILIPSHSDRKKVFLTHNHLEHPYYDDEEITKKIKILEHNMIKNLHESKEKKKRSKTIIEVHMEVLQEWKNEEWNYKKGEFLEICLEVFTKELYGLYPNLTNDELIMENIKSSNDIEKQKNLWNKWIERHRNISEKLNKVDWYNNLKNEWKKEKFYIKEMEELKNKSSNKKQNNLYLEREKDLWKKWILKKAYIIEQYFEQDWFKGLTEEYQNLLNEYKNDEYENDVSIINIEELEHKENYEELYKYIKKKLLSKLCILVLMTILEECKKEEYIEDRELHLDSFINKRKTKKNSEKIPEISDKFIEKYSNVYENSKNSDIQNNIEENFFREEMNDWIGEEVTYVNSTECVSNIDKYYNSTT